MKKYRESGTMNNLFSILISYCLLPIAMLYGFITHIRNKLYDNNILKSRSFETVVFSIGNISMGGTGKTPMIEYLTRLLRDKYKVATLSRGYKRKTTGFILADSNSTSEDIGDEPLQLKNKFNDIIVAVDEDRCEGVELLEKYYKPDIILLDDAFQHRSIVPQLSIILTDSSKLYTDDMVLPAGKLREYKSNAKRADIIIITKTPENINYQYRNKIINKLKPKDNQIVCFSYLIYGKLYSFSDNKKYFCTNLGDTTVVLFSGIANSNPLIDYFNSKKSNLITLNFHDHYNFTTDDILKIVNKFHIINSKNKIIVTTEKDAVRLRNKDLIDILQNLPVYIIPVYTEFHKTDKIKFENKINEQLEN